jgi:hypothetical protein
MYSEPVTAHMNLQAHIVGSPLAGGPTFKPSTGEDGPQRYLAKDISHIASIEL